MEKCCFRAIMLYEFKLGKSAGETVRNMNLAWGEGTASDRTVQRWFKKFREGNLSLKDEPGRGRKRSLENDVLKAAVEGKRESSVRQLGAVVGASSTTVIRHLAELKMVKKLPMYVPHELTVDQKKSRFDICSQLLLRSKNESFIDRIVTCDEKWCLYDNRKRCAMWLDKNDPPKSFPKPNLHPKKTMVSVWWCRKGIIHYSFLKPGDTITAETYCREIDIMYQKLLKMWPALVNRGGVVLLQDNARPHTSATTLAKLAQLGIEVLPHPPYSPDLSPSDYHLFKSLDVFLRQQVYAKQDQVETAFRNFIESRDPEFFRKGISCLPIRWQQCVLSNGGYFV